MSWPVLSELALHLIRTLYLLALSIGPEWVSPEPLPPQPIWLWGGMAAVLIVAVLVLTAKLGRSAASNLTKIGAALVWVAVAAALGAEIFFRGPSAPLARGVPWVAPAVWAALATLASAAAEQWLGSNFKHKRMAAAIVVLGLGAKQLLGSAAYLGSTSRQWRSALQHDANHERAVHELAKPLLQKRKFDDVIKMADACLKQHPIDANPPPAAACACLESRIEANLRTGATAAVLQDFDLGRDRCIGGFARATRAEALALSGQIEEARKEAQAALDEGGDPARIHYVLAVAHERAGLYGDALAELRLAVDAGAGREAKLFAGALCIVTGDLDGASQWLSPLLQQDENDAQARYNLALIADKRADYNAARQGYLAALKADPKLKDARYNLALLTFRAGAIDESRHHTKRFLEAYPDDPRGPQLQQTTGTR